MAITSLSLISRRTVEQDEYPDSSKYVVRNVDSGEQFFFMIIGTKPLKSMKKLLKSMEDGKKWSL